MFLIQSRSKLHLITKDGEENPPVFFKFQKFVIEIFYYLPKTAFSQLDVIKPMRNPHNCNLNYSYKLTALLKGYLLLEWFINGW